ncbi:hypothetical protein BGZ49_008578 [Haplosporangium sp. Z 27]|nr:hypothetical protein BGZ49_008578 [Haplosporangium sp. Z 27]
MCSSTSTSAAQSPTATKKRHMNESSNEGAATKRYKTARQLWDFWHKHLLSNVEVKTPPELYPSDQQELLGRFRKTGSLVPFSGSEFVDMRLDYTPTVMGQKLSKICKERPLVHVLFAVSGAGKTRSIFDIAMQNSGVFLMYIECTLGTVDYAESSTALEPTGDRNFMALYNTLVAADDKYGLKEPHKFKDLTPSDYLLSQLNNGQNCIKAIKTCLCCLTEEELSILFQKSVSTIQSDMPNGSRFSIAIDEASIASKLFDSKFKNVNNHNRGLLTPMLQLLVGINMPVMIAGTAFTLRHGQQIQSGIGKGVSNSYLSEFELLTIDQVKTYIESYLDLSGCDASTIDNWKYLMGRPRLSARLLAEIIEAEKKFGESKSKQYVLEWAVDHTVKAVAGRMQTRLSTLAERYIGSVDPLDRPMQKILEELFVSCRFFGGLARLDAFDDDGVRLIDCGIASLKQTPDAKFIQVEEPLAVEVVNTILGLHYPRPTDTLLNILFDKLKARTNASDTSKGKAWEYLILGRLLDYTGIKVDELIHIFYNDIQILNENLDIVALPKWTHTATFTMKSFGNASMFSHLHPSSSKDDVDVISSMLVDPALRSFILQPSDVMRPDGVYIGVIQNNVRQYWTLLMSAKFYGKSMSSDDAIMDDKNSTDWSRVYCKKNGEANASNLISRLDDVREGYGHSGSLRIHFILPELATSRDNQHRGGYTHHTLSPLSHSKRKVDSVLEPPPKRLKAFSFPVNSITDFKLLREDNYFYVDKTSYIKHIEEDREVLMFLRPKRFGKSLLLSMLKYFYDINEAENFETLFSGLDIFEHAAKLRHNDTNMEMMQQSLRNHINASIRNFCQTYQSILGLHNEGIPTVINSDDCLDSLENLFRLVRSSSFKIYLLIDEYDAMSNEFLDPMDAQSYELVRQKQGLLKGVSPLAVNDYASGFNIRFDITLIPRYSQMLGLRVQDIERALFIIFDMEEEMSLEEKENTVKIHMEKMREYYNGYKFEPSIDKEVYNTNLRLDYQQRLLMGDPIQLVDSNNELNESVLKFIGRHSDSTWLLAELLEKKEIRFASIQTSIRLQDLANIENNDTQFIKSFLFYFGALTFSDRPGWLMIPNTVVTKTIVERVLKPCTINTDSNAYRKAISDLIDKEDIGSLCQYLQPRLKEWIKRGNFGDDRELVTKVMFQISLSTIPQFLSDTEVAVPKIKATSQKYYTPTGYIDLLLVETRRPNKNPRRIVFEFKCKEVSYLNTLPFTVHPIHLKTPKDRSWEALEMKAKDIEILMDEELLDVKCADSTNDNGKSMRQILKEAEVQLKEYMRGLVARDPQDGEEFETTGFVVLTVGSRRFLYNKVELP